MLVARDAVAADQLVYVYPFSLGPQVEVACGEEEVVVMCPAWAVSGLLGPGRHQWQSPEPTKPLAVYFVLTGPVEVPFDMVTQFLIPATGTQVLIRATGSVLVRVADPGLLIAQFVGLPFDRVNDGLLASVTGSVERMLVKVLPRKVAAAGTVKVVTDPAVTAGLADELSSYNPTCGAVFGVEFVRFADLQVRHVGANLEPQEVSGWIGGNASADLAATIDDAAAAPSTASGTIPPGTASGTIPPGTASGTIPPGATSGTMPASTGSGMIGSGMIGSGMIGSGMIGSGMIGSGTLGSGAASGEIGSGAIGSGAIGSGAASGEIGAGTAAGTIGAGTATGTIPPGAADGQGPLTSVSGEIGAQPAPPANGAEASTSTPELPLFAIGSRVLVSLADGLLHAGTVLSAMQGYYELEIGGADQPLWVPGNQITPQL